MWHRPDKPNPRPQPELGDFGLHSLPAGAIANNNE